MRNAILAFVVVLVIGVAAGGAIYIMRLSSPKGRLDTVLKERAGEETRAPWAPRLLALPLIVLAFIGAGSYMNQQAGCRQCHGAPIVKSVADSPHRRVQCMACHSDQGFTGPVRQMVTYGRWVYGYASSRKVPKLEGVELDERACLSCHGEVTGETVVRNGIKVRHSDFLKNGSRCAECHGATAHGQASANPTKPTMSECLPCHNGKTASANCDVCHSKDPREELPSGEGFAKVRMDKDQQKQTCFNCHNPGPCYRCHGVAMPHPQGWTRVSMPGLNLHARVAFESNRSVCWRCHFKQNRVFEADEDVCKPCHNPGLALRVHGGAVWLKEHGPEAIGQKPGVFAACFDCHVPTLCDDCHPASYKKRYNPVTGYDSYRREVPLDPSLVP